MNPHGRHVSALAIVLIVIASVLGGSAVSAVTADRSATIHVAGDDSALLALSPHENADPGLFSSGSTLSISVSPGSTTTYAELFNVTNQGSQPVSIWIDDHDYVGGGSGDLAGDIIGDADEDNTANVTFFNSAYGGNESCENGVPSVEGAGNAVEIAVGETLVVGLQANTSDVSGEEADLLDEMTVHADASIQGVNSELNTQC